MLGLPAWVLAMVAATSLVGSAQTEWDLVWSDEFDQGSIDPANWQHLIGDGTDFGLPSGWGNNELQYYTDRLENSYVTQGMLNIAARAENYEGFNYTSARMVTRGLQEFQYGRIEARIKVPTGKGMWPAFWMLPTNSPYGTWAADGEIDVMETVNVPYEAHGTIHFGGAWPRNTRNGGTFYAGEHLADDFHVYAVEWAPDRFTWSIDGTPYYTVTSDAWWSENGGNNPRAPFDHPFHLLLNVAVGGDWPGSPDGTTQFPQVMRIDWVRVYQPVQSPYGGSPHVVPGRIEAEEFDEGWAEQAYADSDLGNNGEAFRLDTDVDIEPCSEGRYNVGWIAPGEWIEYTIDAQHSGSYRMRARVASIVGGLFSLEFGGVDRTGMVNVPPTGGWQTWTTVSSDPFFVAKGEQVVRFVNRGSSAQEFNINWFELQKVRPGLDSNGPSRQVSPSP